MKNKIGKFEKLRKMEHVKKKTIRKPEQKSKPVIKEKNRAAPESREKILDYLEQKRNEANILPLSGPNMKQNYVKCAFYSKGYCKYGRNCKYSHNFVEKMTIEPSNSNINREENNLAFKKSSSFHLPLSMIVTHMKTFTITYKDKSAKTFVAVADRAKKIYIYALGQRAHISAFDFKNPEEEIIEFDFFPFQFTKSDDYTSASALSSNMCMLTIHKNDCMRLWNVFKPRCLKTYRFELPNLGRGSTSIYKIEKVKLMKELMANTNQQIPPQVRAKLSGLKDITTFMVMDNSGTLLFIDLKKGVFLSPIYIGIKINDIAFMKTTTGQSAKNLNEADIRTLNPYKENHMEKMPNYVAVAGKGIHVWDLIKKKSVKTMAYNNYAYYLSIASFEVSEMGTTKCLIAAMGKLQDRIISFGDQVFIEIWNPMTGGCIKRITKSNLKFNTDLHRFYSGFLQVFPIKISKESEEKEKVCIVGTQNRAEIWNLFNEEKVAELEVEREVAQLCFEPFVCQDERRFKLIDQGAKDKLVEAYSFGN